MRHATPAALDALEPLLARVREVPGLKEKSRGTFYKGSRAYLHFHEDPAGYFADIRLDEDFTRLPATTPADWDALLSAITGSHPVL